MYMTRNNNSMALSLNMYLRRCEHYCCSNCTSQAIYTRYLIHVQIHNVLYYIKCKQHRSFIRYKIYGKQGYLRSSLAPRGGGRFRLGGRRYDIVRLLKKLFSVRPRSQSSEKKIQLDI